MSCLRPLVATLALAGLLLPAARAADPDAPEWRVPAVTRVAVELPSVADAEPDGPLPPGERFVTTLTAEGALHFGPAARYVAGDGDAGKATLSLLDADATARALTAWSGAIREAARAPGLRGEEGGTRLRLLLRADRARLWLETLWLLEAAAAPDIGVTRMQLAVRKAEGDAEAAWRLPHELPTGYGWTGPGLRPRHVRLELDASADDRVLLRLQEAFDAGGGPARRVLAELVAEEGGSVDPAALRETLDAFLGVGRSAGETTLLVATLGLTPRGARRWRVGDALPLLSTLRALRAQVHLQAAPAIELPTPATPRVEGRRRPYAGPPERITSRARRWAHAVEEALRWLAAHQSPSGLWEAEGWSGWCDGDEVGERRPEGSGSAEHDVGVTGLALQAFLGAGYTHRGEHPYVDAVRRGVYYLKRVQDEEGCYGAREGLHWVYDHAAATWAMVEAAAMTGDAKLRASAQRGLDFIAVCRNPYFAWRYGIKPGDNDTSVSGWMLMPLAVARIANADRVRRGEPAAFVLDEEAFDGVKAWLDKMTDKDYGRTGYIQRGGSPARPQALIDRFPGDKSESMTALALTLRVEIGENPRRSRLMVRGLELLEQLLPRWTPTDGAIDMYYWYWGSLATWQAGRRAWKRWSDALDAAVVDNQRKDTTACFYRGSWDPAGPWGEVGGRVYATALMALALETPTRYDRRFER